MFNFQIMFFIYHMYNIGFTAGKNGGLTVGKDIKSVWFKISEMI